MACSLSGCSVTHALILATLISHAFAGDAAPSFTALSLFYEPANLFNDDDVSTCPPAATTFTIATNINWVIVSVTAYNITVDTQVTIDGTDCGNAAELATGDRAECFEGLKGTSVVLTSATAIAPCEINVDGYYGVPPVVPAETEQAFFRSDGENPGEYTYSSRLTWRWNENDAPTMESFSGTFNWQDGGGDVDISQIQEGTSNSLLIDNQALMSFAINDLTAYPVVITNTFDGVDSSPGTVYASRGPLCWSGTCADNDCIAGYETTWLTSLARDGVCTMIRSFFTEAGAVLDPPTETYLPTSTTADSRVLADIIVGNLVGDGNIFATEEEAWCYTTCYGGADAFEHLGDTERECAYLGRVFCCVGDFCINPAQYAAGNLTLDDSCLGNLMGLNVPALGGGAVPGQDWSRLANCFYPQVFSVTAINGASATVRFYVPREVPTGYDFVNLYLFELNDVTAVRTGPDVCTGPFATETYYECVLTGLTPGHQYFVHTEGQITDGDLSVRSPRFHVYSGDSLSVTCTEQTMSIGFQYYDVALIPSGIDFGVTRVANVPTSTVQTAGTEFNDETTIRSTYDTPTFVPSSDLDVFRGYPSSFNVRIGNGRVEQMYFGYDFIANDVVHGVADAAGDLETVDLTGRRVTNVKGTFDTSDPPVLVAIQITSTDGTTPADSTCYGTGDCTGFDQQPPAADEYITGFRGRYDATSIIELGANYAHLAVVDFNLADPSCLVTTVVDWNDIANYRFEYNNLNIGGGLCSTNQIISNGTVDGQSNFITYSQTVHAVGETAGSVVTLDGVGGAVISRSSGSAGLTARCVYDSNRVVGSSFGTLEEEAYKQTSFQNLDFSLHIFQDNKFTDGYQGTPILVVGDTFYFAAQLDSVHTDMSIIAHTCYASQSQTPAQTTSYIIEENGCGTDNTFMRQTTYKTATFDAFSMTAFAFEDAPTALVYLHCDIRACIPGMTACEVPTCPSSRRRRDVFSPVDGASEHHVVSRPFVLQAPDLLAGEHENKVGKLEVESASLFTHDGLVQATGTVVIFLLIVITALARQMLLQRRARQGPGVIAPKAGLKMM